ncbi:MAG: hypothetical protein KF911_10905 [Pseudomonadales bacterium]|nr:hypothetical protein [Pseudomonadales bacterium]
MAAIHTLNARGNVMLSVLREYFSWTDARTFREIRRFHSDLLDILNAKGIDYDLLRTALTPQQTKQEVAFLFDEERCDNAVIPGVECADALFKLLDRNTTHSILGGDLIDDKDEIARKLLSEAAVVAKDLNLRHPCFCYVLYVNNLSCKAVNTIHDGLKAHGAYLGYVPCTYASLAKTFISMSLVNLAIKHKTVVILGHEDDRPNTEDYNLHLHDYTVLGLNLKSIQPSYFSTFLAYKIERMFLEKSDDDLEIALRSMSSEAAPLADFTVLIEEAKFSKNLQTKKLGKLERAGVAQLTKADLEEAIRRKLRSNYLYNMEWIDERTHQLSKFNIMLEFPRVGGFPERLLVSLEYKPAEKVLRLLTAC